MKLWLNAEAAQWSDDPMRISRRRFFQAAVVAVPGGIGYAAFGEPHWLEVTHTKISAGKKPLPRPVRIVQLSDFHLSKEVPLSLISRAIRLGVEQKPDVICVTGDFITQHLKQEDDFAKELLRLAKAAPTFASLGNHDGGQWAGAIRGLATTKEIRDFAAGAGLRVLHNESIVLPVGGTQLRLTGLGDLWSGEFDPDSAFRNQDAAADVHVVMSHNPDSKDDLKNFNWDLMLCGHTHGGQIALPLIGGRIFAPVRDSRFISGRYDWAGRQIFVTRGIGNVYGIRFNCRPEVAVLTLA